MAAEWYCALRGRTEGPLDAAKLLRQRRKGSISDATLVWREGMEEWLPLGDVREQLQTDAAAPDSPAHITSPTPSPPEGEVAVEYRVVELQPLSAWALEELLNRWSPEGWRLDQVVEGGLVVLRRE